MQSVDDAIRVIRGADYDARFKAEQFLVQIGDVSSLAPYLADTDWKVRMFVARVLAQLPGPSHQIAELLQKRLEVEDDKWVFNNLNLGIRSHSTSRTA